MKSKLWLKRISAAIRMMLLAYLLLIGPVTWWWREGIGFDIRQNPAKHWTFGASGQPIGEENYGTKDGYSAGVCRGDFWLLAYSHARNPKPPLPDLPYFSCSWIAHDVSKWHGTLNWGFGTFVIGSLREADWTACTGFIIPFWPISLIAGCLLGLDGRRIYRAAREERRTTLNLCPTCAYDLRAHTPGQKCPECGTVIAGIAEQTRRAP